MKTTTKQTTKLDLGCGQNCQDGFQGVDIADIEGVEHVVDLTVFPWPFDDDSVDEIYSSHYVEHTYPLGGAHDGLVAFMDEVWRICKHDAKVKIVHPYLKSDRAFQDPTHTRFIPDATWHYFSRDWRESQKLDHYPIRSNFSVDNIGCSFFSPWDQKHHEAQAFALQHYWNVATDLGVELTAIKE